MKENTHQKGTYQACHGDLRSRGEPSWLTLGMCVGLVGFERGGIGEREEEEFQSCPGMHVSGSVERKGS